MISVHTARRLRDGGVRWLPAAGDHFIIADHDMDDDVFVLSNMTAEVHRYPDADVIGFNGTTEWALDSVDTADALWLPRESQLRSLLGGAFRELTPSPEGWQVVIAVNAEAHAFTHADAEEAYGRALAYLVTGDAV